MEVCRKYEILCGEHFKDCGEVELGDKTTVDYLGFYKDFLYLGFCLLV